MSREKTYPGKGKSKQRRFSVQEGTSKKDLRSRLANMGVTKYDVHEFSDQSCRVAFVRNEREYQFICDEFNNYPDNLRACERAIRNLWFAFEDYCVRTTDVPLDFGTIFMGFAVESGKRVLAITDGKKPCWEVLGLSKDATKDEIRVKYKELAKVHHPDVGGDKNIFSRINNAYEEFVSLKA